MGLTPLQEGAARKRARSESGERQPSWATRQHEGPTPEEGLAATPQLVDTPPVAANFGSLPNELQLAVVWELANLPNRQLALDSLTNLRNAHEHFDDLILEYKDLRQASHALQDYPGVRSRYVAVCHDVVGRMPVRDALQKNGPLSNADEVRAEDVYNALQDVTPEQLANLADAFSAGTDAASKEALSGVAWAAVPDSPVSGPLRTANIHDLATLTGAFTKNGLALEDLDVAVAIEAVAWQVAAGGNELLSPANIEQIATLAGAFSVHEDYPSRHDDENFDEAIKALALHVSERGNELLSPANIEQIATLADVFMGHREDVNAEGSIELLAWQVAQRGSALLTAASMDELVTLKAAFMGVDELVHVTALATVEEQIARDREESLPSFDTKSRPQLNERERPVQR